MFEGTQCQTVFENHQLIWSSDQRNRIRFNDKCDKFQALWK